MKNFVKKLNKKLIIIGLTITGIISASGMVLLNSGASNVQTIKDYQNEKVTEEVQIGVGAWNYDYIFQKRWLDRNGIWRYYKKESINSMNESNKIKNPSSYSQYRIKKSALNKECKRLLNETTNPDDRLRLQNIIEFTDAVEKSYSLMVSGAVIFSIFLVAVIVFAVLLIMCIVQEKNKKKTKTDDIVGEW